MNQESKRRLALEGAIAQLNSITEPLNDVTVAIDAWCNEDQIKEAKKIFEDLNRWNSTLYAFLRDRLDEI